MSFTSDYINSIHQQTFDLKNYYTQNNRFEGLVFGSLETFGKYVTVSFGHIISTSALTLTPLFFAIDTIEVLGEFIFNFFRNNVDYSKLFTGLFCLSIAAYGIYYGFILDFNEVYQQSFEILSQIAHPFVNRNSPQFLAEVMNYAQESRYGAIFIGFMSSIPAYIIIYEAVTNDHFGDHMQNISDNLLKISQIALASLCPPLIYAHI
jgi:hypothetical protein